MRKTGQEVGGIILLILGTIGVTLAAIEYPIWNQNRQALADKVYIGVDTQEDHALVAFQWMIVVGGFGFGGIFLLVGIFTTGSAMSYNSKLDTMDIQRSFSPLIQQYNIAPGQKAFCPYCGAPLLGGAIFCRVCGRLTQK
jgi:hypothetical protein